MEYSSDKKMTRKEYLKSKSKGKLWIRVIKYTLLLAVIALLGVYLFRQLNIYNNVTKIANKVVEDTALARTMKMYYVADGYTKDAPTEVMLYKAYDNSRVRIENTNGMYNLQVQDGYLYGIKDSKLYCVNLETNEQTLVIEQDIRSYVLSDKRIYFYSVDKDTKKTGIYIYSANDKKCEQIINIEVYQMILDSENIYVISKGKTEKSIIRYNLNGSGRKIISDKEIVSYITQDKNNIYFISSDKLYKIKKNGKDQEQLIKDDIYIDSDIDNMTSAQGPIMVRNEKVYYIKKAEEAELCEYDINSKEWRVIDKKNIESLSLVDGTLYYKINNSLEVYKINLETGKGDKVTSIRGNEYICIN